MQWSGRQPPDCIDAPPSQPLLKHILNQVYNRAVTNPEALNSYEPFSPEVYGETSFELVTEIIKHTHLSENDVFMDLGSGKCVTSIVHWHSLIIMYKINVGSYSKKGTKICQLTTGSNFTSGI